MPARLYSIEILKAYLDKEAGGTARSFDDHRQEIAEDLQKIFNRSPSPVVTPDDLAGMKNIIRPALPMHKFGEAGRSYFGASPLIPPEFWKMAAWYDDMWSGVKNVGKSLLAVPEVVYKGVPGLVSGVRKGWNENSGLWAPLGAISEGWSGLTAPLGQGAQNLYKGMKGIASPVTKIPGISHGWNALMGSQVGSGLKWADKGLENYVLPYSTDLALMAVPGGQLTAAGRAASLATIGAKRVGDMSRLGRGLAAGGMAARTGQGATLALAGRDILGKGQQPQQPQPDQQGAGPFSYMMGQGLDAYGRSQAQSTSWDQLSQMGQHLVGQGANLLQPLQQLRGQITGGASPLGNIQWGR